MKNIYAALLASTMIMSAISTSMAGVHWVYEGDVSPEHWGELSSDFKKCADGKNQSPINITEAHKGKTNAPLTLHYNLTKEELVNNGHTIQISTANKDDYLIYNGTKYYLKQFHFHTPSENKINGKDFPLEGHFVHADDNGKLLVLAVMFEEGQENPQLQQIIAAVPNDANKTVDLKTPINIEKLLPSNEHYYDFEGSLTTPPCSESVRWIVLKNTLHVSKKQVESFNKILKHHNNRPVQPLNNRVIEED